MSRKLRIDRAIYDVDDKSRTYRFFKGNDDWKRLDPEENERNKRTIDGYTRILADGTTKIFLYRTKEERKPGRLGRMTVSVTLKKGRVPASLVKAMRAYYGRWAEGAAYVDGRWKQWAGDPAVVAFRADADGRRAGWIVYNRTRSTVEELCTPGEKKGAVETAMLDALVAEETLVSAEAPDFDRSKIDFLVGYGFRPYRRSEVNGTPLTTMELSTAVLLGKLAGRAPVRAYRRKEVVAVERVSSIDSEKEIKAGLERVINHLGGVRKFVKEGDTVVIKPNIVSDHGLKDGVYKGGIVTDVRVIKALVELLLPVAEKIVIAEGSSINRSETAKMFSHYGYDRLMALDPRKVRLVDLNGDEVVEKKVPGARRMASRKIPLTLEEADVIISVPVLKLHFAAGVSLAIKHLQGAVPPLEKYMTHFFGLWQNLVNIHHLIKPALTIIDGLVGQEDFGPVSGTPKQMNLLMGGTNPVAVDATAMRIMGLDPCSSPPVFLAYMQGLGPVEEEKIKVLGVAVKDVASPFREPEINVRGGADFRIHAGEACNGCRGYLHFVLNKLRRPDPLDEGRLLIDRPFEPKVNIYLGPAAGSAVDPNETNVFMGLCQLHNVDGKGTHLPGCPPHAEVIVNGIFALFPDVERPQYADKSEEAKLGEMLEEILSMK